MSQLPDRCAQALERHLRPAVFKALCDPTRLTLLGRLATSPEPLTVTQLQGSCGVHLSGVSRHLALLRDAGVVAAQRRGREVAYRVDFEAVVGTLRGLASALEDCCTRYGCCGAAPEESKP